jgi:hypothetical protein
MLEQVIDARRHNLGGFEVGRVLPYMKRRMVGPFVFWDHMGPVRLPPHIPRTTDVRPHPHIGLSTVTYLIDGEMTHRDSLGMEQVIRPGEVNWMTSGSGITHSERFDGLREKGGWMDGIQAWVALPDASEETDPAFDHYSRDDQVSYSTDDMAATLIAGEAFGAKSKVKTHSPLFYIHTELKPGARTSVPSGHRERAAYVARGRIEYDGHEYTHGQMLVFAPGGEPVVTALEATTLMQLGGEPLGERFIWWNFVSSRRERIEQAKADWQAGRFKLPTHDDSEFIPLPEEPPKPTPNPMS